MVETPRRKGRIHKKNSPRAQDLQKEIDAVRDTARDILSEKPEVRNIFSLMEQFVRSEDHNRLIILIRGNRRRPYPWLRVQGDDVKIGDRIVVDKIRFFRAFRIEVRQNRGQLLTFDQAKDLIFQLQSE